ncbi:MAG: 1-acyl-sn-glycerol-3-phosphate acyltransferase [Phycisphaeraceae bacterium]|nr:1-acyl-sn-glycerol-3-phosphate acyltransferase [Phycisphaeraceae bacterium]
MKDWKYETAADHGLAPKEKLVSLKREVGLGGYLLQRAWRAGTRLYLRCYHRLEVIGKDALPREAPFILVCNHTSHLDTLAIASALPWRLRQSVFPIGAGDTFFETPVAAFFSGMLLNALPLWRHRCGRHALDELRTRLISEPAIYILFPEGTRTRDGRTKPFKSGIGMLIAESPAPVVPCHISGAFEALPPDRRLPRPRSITLRIGTPLRFEDVSNRREGWDRIRDEIEAAVAALGAGKEPG